MRPLMGSRSSSLSLAALLSVVLCLFRFVSAEYPYVIVRPERFEHYIEEFLQDDIGVHPENYVKHADTWAFLRANIPHFDTPDRTLEKIYYFRWYTYRKHIKEIPLPATPYIITEFLPDVPWAGAYNSIPCAAAHHFREGRWMHNSTFLESYARFWFIKEPGGGNPRSYSFWPADSIREFALVTGNTDLLKELYRPLVKNFRTMETTNFNAIE